MFTVMCFVPVLALLPAPAAPATAGTLVAGEVSQVPLRRARTLCLVQILLVSGSTRAFSGNTAALRTVQAVAAEGIAAEIADMSPKVVRLAKTVMNQVENMSLKEGYELETRMIARTREPEFADESAEASLAWLEKRKPRFAASYAEGATERRVHKV